jgi:N-acetylglucosaminyl-diphospho-decaprenol L-rhamnosyltransferase
MLDGRRSRCRRHARTVALARLRRWSYGREGFGRSPVPDVRARSDGVTIGATASAPRGEATSTAVAIVVVHHHAASLLARAVETLRADLEAAGLPGEIVVVDNGSTAAERSCLRALPVRVLEPGVNLGFAGGVNLGVEATRAPRLVAMNPDVELRTGCLGALVAALDAGAGVAGPRFFWDREARFLLPPTELRTRGEELRRRLASLGPRSLARARRSWRDHAWTHWRAERALASRSLSGALLAFRREAWRQAGPLDPGFRLYFEDDDWVHRVASRGLRTVYEPAAEAVHLHNQSAREEARAAGWFAESAARFARRHYGTAFVRGVDALTRLVPQATSPREETSSSRLDGVPLRLPAAALAAASSSSLWVEVSPSPLGFPAAAERVADLDRLAVWSLPEQVWQHLAPGRYGVRLVSEAGRELWEGWFARA